MAENARIYENILRNIASGVIAVNGRGGVSAFNAAAGRILGLSPDEIIGRSMAEVIVVARGLDELTDAVLEAVHHGWQSDQRIVEIRVGGEVRSLSVSTSYLDDVDCEKTGGAGVVAVFEDISEVKELRESEIRLAREGRERHAEIEQACIRMEARNAEFDSALRKLRIARWSAIGLVLALFIGIGIHSWGGDLQTVISARLGARTEPEASQGPVQTVTIEPRTLQSHVSALGRLEPLRSVAVNSPFAGTIKRIHFESGKQVERGQPLVEIDTAKIESELREARVAYINAVQEHEIRTDEASNTTVSSARQNVRNARVQLEVAREERDETRMLFERGVVPEDRYQANVRAYESQVLSERSAQQSLRVVLKHNENQREVTALNLENARIRLEQLELSVAQAVVTAPVDGVVLSVEARAGGSGGQDALAGQSPGTLAEGQRVDEGARLLTIGDLTGLSIVSEVDEIDVAGMKEGLEVRVSGDGFQGIRLDGEITHVSSEAKTGRGIPKFEMTTQVKHLDAEHRRVLRIGMSARLDVLVYEQPHALVVPIHAVDTSTGVARVRVREPATGAIREVEVSTGVATLDEVEILEGLDPGAEVVTGGA